MSALPFKAIAAMGRNRVIGRDNAIPWHLPEDFRWFKKRTMGGVMVMGRKTFQCIGRLLPGRETVVLTRSPGSVSGIRTISSLDELDLGVDPREVFICGGGQVYEQALPRCSDLYLTRVRQAPPGDIFFPPFEDLFDEGETLRKEAEFSIVHYRRRPAT